MELKIFELQPELLAYRDEIEERKLRFDRKKKELTAKWGSLGDFANGHLYYGLHYTGHSWLYREWAPAADALHLIGDFNGWNRESHPMKRLPDGSWEIELPAESIAHLTNYKVCVSANGRRLDRIPLYARYVRQNWESRDFTATVWKPEQSYEWHDGDFEPKTNIPPLIYEAHVGMATEECRVGTYREFADNILPRIRADGYNTVQLMAIMEHPYYGSFGYHVSNFFAPSSRFGTPDELKYLIDTAHSLGLSVFLDLVHSHAVKNVAEGISLFDGTETQFFKAGQEGYHSAWDSRVFDYGKDGVVHFLLSDLKYWIEEFHFDGFRFDGVGSMLYRNHGINTRFDGLASCFSENTDLDAVTYLQLATELVRELKPDAVLIAEDVSAMPGLCLPVRQGGIGFDYRLGMGLPDYYIRMIKERRIGDWDMAQLTWELLGHRRGEKIIAYAESHDQALVGDQTIMFRLAGAAMYTDMHRESRSLTVQNAIALHKLIRLVTVCAGGSGYLNFMGNEFGHPEWIDFPREGNGWSHEHARRQWSLAENGALKYRYLGEFDRAMIKLFRENGILGMGEPQCIRFEQQSQLLAFRRGEYIFVFNFHPTCSQTDFFIPSGEGSYRPVLSTDEKAFGGWNNVAMDYVYSGVETDAAFGQGFRLYLPALTAVALKKVM